MIPGTSCVGAVLRQDKAVGKHFIPVAGAVRVIDPEVDRGFILLLEIPPADGRVFQLARVGGTHDSLHVRPLVLQPFGADFPGRERDAILFVMEIALAIDHHPFAELVGPDLGDAVVSATQAVFVVEAVDSEFAGGPAQGLGALHIRQAIVAAPVFGPVSGVIQHFEGTFARLSGGAVGDTLADPVLEEALFSPIHRGRERRPFPVRSGCGVHAEGCRRISGAGTGKVAGRPGDWTFQLR